VFAPHMSAFGGKADMTVCGISLSRSLLGVKRTWVDALQMSAFDPKRTSLAALHMSAFGGKADIFVFLSAIALRQRRTPRRRIAKIMSTMVISIRH
jgi:hypothetical protein